MPQRYQTVIHLCAIAATVPFLVLAAYCHPYFDDYSTAIALRSSGFWLYFVDTYLNWTGRYAFLLANAGHPLRFGSLGTYQWAAAGLVVGLVGSCYGLALGLTTGNRLRRAPRLALGSGLVVAMLALFPSPAEGFYWILGGYNYVLAIPVGLGGLAAGCHYAAHGPGRYKWALLGTFAAAALFPGFSEFTACLSLSLAVGLLLAYPHAGGVWRMVLAVLALGSVCMLAAPGNLARLHAQPHQWLVAGSLLLAAKASAYTLLNWLAYPAFWLLTALGLPLFARLAAGPGPIALLTRKPLLWPLLLASGVAGCYLLSYLSTHQPIPLRARNVLYAYFLVTAMLSVVGGMQWAQRHARLVPHLPPAILYGLLIIALLADGNGHLRNAEIGRGSNTVIVAYRDWLSGDAARFDSAERARYQLLRTAAADSVAVPPLPVTPPSLFYYDLAPTPGLWGNQAMALYFGKKAIWVDGKPAASKR